MSGGEGSELYRVALAGDYLGLSVDELSTRLRGEHRATLLAVTRDGRSMLDDEPARRFPVPGRR